MASGPKAWLSRRLRDRASREWSAISARGGDLRGDERTQLRDQAVALRRDLTAFLKASAPTAVRSQMALAALEMPAGTDWRWRPDFVSERLTPAGMAAPDSGQRLGDEVALWHDCPDRMVILRQTLNTRATDLATYGLGLEVLSFGGSYLSLSVDLPEAALSGLTKSHILRMETDIGLERDTRIYARLNISNGPNVEQLLRELPAIPPGQSADLAVEFDLAFTDMNTHQLKKIWLDLIFESPLMNRIDIREMLLSRRLRADI